MDNSQFLRGTEVASLKLAKFSKQATVAGQNISRSLGVAFGLVATAVASTAAEYDRANASLRAIAGDAAANELIEQSNQLGRTSIFTATAVASAQKELVKLGLTVDKVKAVTDQASQLATVFDSELKETAETVAVTLNQFGLEADQATRVVDVMSYALTNTALDMNKWAESMKYAGSVANSLGITVEETAALLGVLADAGIDSSLAGVALRRILPELVKRYGSVSEALRNLNEENLSYFQAEGIIDKRQAGRLVTLTKNVDKYDELVRGMKEAEGITKRLSDIFGDQLFFALEEIKAALESVAITLGNALGPMIKQTARLLQRFAKFLADLDPATIESFFKVWFELVATGVILLVAGQITSMANSVIGFITNASRVAAVLNPWTLALGLLTGAIVTYLSRVKPLETGAERIARAQEDAARETTRNSLEIEALVRAYGNAEGKQKQQERIMARLKRLAPEYFSKFEAGKTTMDELTEAVNRYNEAMLQSAIQRKFKEEKDAAFDDAVEAQENVLALEREIAKKQKEYEDLEAAPRSTRNRGNRLPKLRSEIDSLKAELELENENLQNALDAAEELRLQEEELAERLRDPLNINNKDGDGTGDPVPVDGDDLSPYEKLREEYLKTAQTAKAAFSLDGDELKYFDAMADAKEKLAVGLKELGPTYGPLSEQIYKNAEAYKAKAQAIRDAKEAAEEDAKANEDALKKQEQEEARLDQQRQANFQNLVQLVGQFAEVVSNALVDSIFDPEVNFFDELKNNFRDLVKDMLKQLLKLIVTFALLKLLFPGVSQGLQLGQFVANGFGFQNLQGAGIGAKLGQGYAGMGMATGGTNNNMSLVVRGTDLHSAQDGAARGYRRLYG